MSKRNIQTLGILGVAAICLLCIFLHSKRIENDLLTRSSAALTKAGLVMDGLSFSGRDATILGHSREDLEQAKEIVSGVYGVRTAMVRLVANTELTKKERFPESTSILKLAFSDGTIVAEGILPNEQAKSNLLEKIKASVANAEITENMQLKDGAAPARWVEALPSVLPVIHANVKNGALVIKDDSVKITGKVKNIHTKQMLESAIRTTFPDRILENELTVSERNLRELQNRIRDLLAARKIQFESNSDSIGPDGKRVLDEIAALLMQYPRVHLEIAGHTDSIGKENSNIELSQRRAETVFRYLVNHHIAPDRLHAVGYGETRPLAPNATVQGQQENRRVEFFVREYVTKK